MFKKDVVLLKVLGTNFNVFQIESFFVSTSKWDRGYRPDLLANKSTFNQLSSQAFHKIRFLLQMES